MIPVIPVVILGGALVMGSLATSGVANINNYIQQKQQIVNEQIQDELDEVIEDYEYCENIHFKNLVDEGEIEEELSQEEFEEIRDEFIYTYSREVDNRVDISNKTLDYMKKQLDKDDQKYVERSELTGDSRTTLIVNEWLKKVIN